MRLHTVGFFRRRARWWRSLWRGIQAQNVPILGLYFGIILAVSGVLIYLVERGANRAFASLGDGLWWALVTLTTVGYGDKYPITTLGRVLAGGVILFGMGMVGVVTGKIASVLVERRIREVRGLRSAEGLSGHVVVLGWRPDMHLFVRDILAANPDRVGDDVVLVNMGGESENEPLRTDFPGLRYVQGDVIDPLVLKRVSVARASRVFVLADTSGGRSDQETDARTVMAVMNIENLAPAVYTCAEVLDTQYVEYLRLARCDEVILSREYGRMMLATAAASAGISRALLQLMDVSEGSALVGMDVPEPFRGRTFGELAAHLKSATGALAVGLLENTGQSVAIKRDALRQAQKTADVATLVENLQRVKGMVSNQPVLNPPDDYPIAPHARVLVVPRAPAGGAGSGGAA